MTFSDVGSGASLTAFASGDFVDPTDASATAGTFALSATATGNDGDYTIAYSSTIAVNGSSTFDPGVDGPIPGAATVAITNQSLSTSQNITNPFPIGDSWDFSGISGSSVTFTLDSAYDYVVTASYSPFSTLFKIGGVFLHDGGSNVFVDQEYDGSAINISGTLAAGTYTFGSALDHIGGAALGAATIDDVTLSLSPVPEPSAAWLLAAGLGLGLRRRRLPQASTAFARSAVRSTDGTGSR